MTAIKLTNKILVIKIVRTTIFKHLSSKNRFYYPVTSFKSNIHTNYVLQIILLTFCRSVIQQESITINYNSI